MSPAFLLMKKIFILILIFLELQACSFYAWEKREIDTGRDNGVSEIPPSYAGPAGGTMKTKP